MPHSTRDTQDDPQNLLQSENKDLKTLAFFGVLEKYDDPTTL